MLKTRELSSGQQLVIWSARTWMAGLRLRRAALPEIVKVYELSKIGEAACDVDEFFTLLASGPRAKLSFGMPPCPCVHPAEATLINCLATLQRDLDGCAHVILERMMMPAEAKMAMHPARSWAKELSRADWSLDMITVEQIIHGNQEQESEDQADLDRDPDSVPPLSAPKKMRAGRHTEF